jgi:hypothetical protein
MYSIYADNWRHVEIKDKHLHVLSILIYRTVQTRIVCVSLYLKFKTCLLNKL